MTFNRAISLPPRGLDLITRCGTHLPQGWTEDTYESTINLRSVGGRPGEANSTSHSSCLDRVSS
jgi:hypothetical protein